MVLKISRLATSSFLSKNKSKQFHLLPPTQCSSSLIAFAQMFLFSHRLRPIFSKFTSKRSSSQIMESVPDWDRPFTKEELDEIEAAFDSATSSIKQRRIHQCTEDINVQEESNTRRRRLPNWGGAHNQASTSNRRLPNLEGMNSLIGSPNAAVIGSPSNPRHPFPNFLRHCSNQVNLKVEYPVMIFGGSIIYCRTVSEVEKASMELMEIIEEKKRSTEKVTLGFDIEWRPTFRKGQGLKKAAVMQICADTSHCYVMHIFHSGIPPVLQSLLEDPTSVKVGVSIAGDASKVWRDYDVCVKALEDLSKLANVKLGGKPKMWSLRSLAETFICKQIPKPNGIRLGNWEAKVLSNEQLKYAALDAFASWHLYQVIASFPDAPNNQNAEVNALPSS